MNNKKNNEKKKYKYSYDPDLSEAPKLTIYKETFGGSETQQENIIMNSRE